MIILILLLILLVVIFCFWIHFLMDSRKLNVSGPFPLPFLGNGHLLVGDSTRVLPTLTRLAREYDDAFRIYLFTNRYVCLSHPRHIEPLLKSKTLINKGRAYDALQPWLGHGLLTASGDEWRGQRKLLTPAFNYYNLQKALPVFLKNEKILRLKLRARADGTPVDLTAVCAALTFDNVAETTFERSFNMQNVEESEYAEAVDRVTDLISTRIRNPFMQYDVLFTMTMKKKELDGKLKTVHAYSDRVITSRRNQLKAMSEIDKDSKNAKSENSFMDLLLLAQMENKELDDKAIRSQVDTVLFAGHDTVSSAIMYTLFCLSNDQRVQQRVFDEQLHVFRDDIGRDPTYSDLQQMTYLDMVIKESLRLYPPAPMLERLVTEDTDLAGLHLPKDTLIFINIYEMHRKPELYNEPDKFVPERFADNQKSKFSWTPFSAGPRNCIGQKYAMTEIKATLSATVRNFKLLASGRAPTICWEVTLKSKNGVHVSFLPRTLST